MDGDMEERIRSIVSMVREDIHVLSIRVDHMRIKLYTLRTHTDDTLEQFRRRMETGFAEILATIQHLALAPSPVGSFNPPLDSPPSSLLANHFCLVTNPPPAIDHSHPTTTSLDQTPTPPSDHPTTTFRTRPHLGY